MSPGQGIPMKATYRTELSQHIKHVQPSLSLTPDQSPFQTHPHRLTIQISDGRLEQTLSLCPFSTLCIFYTQTKTTHTDTHRKQTVTSTQTACPLSMKECRKEFPDTSQMTKQLPVWASVVN